MDTRSSRLTDANLAARLFTNLMLFTSREGKARCAGLGLAILAVALLPASSAFAVKPKPGDYSGKTDQGLPVSFEVKNKRFQDSGTGEISKRLVVKNFRYTVSASCELGDSIEGQFAFTFYFELSGKQKRFADGGSNASGFTDFRGAFSGKNVAEGTVEYHGKNPPDSITPNQCESGEVGWTARRSR